MKVDEPSVLSKPGDVSPLAPSLSNLPDVPQRAPPKAPKKSSEPSFEKLANLSRVTPAQLPYISFLPDSRYQPVRAVYGGPTPVGRGKAAGKGGKTVVASLKYAGGGGIVLLIDRRPGEAAELIQMEAPAGVIVTTVTTVTTVNDAAAAPVTTAGAPSVDNSAPETDPPESFEYPFDED